VAVTVKIIAFWDVSLCSFIDRYRHFEGNYLPPSSGGLESALCWRRWTVVQGRQDGLRLTVFC